jgi:hypothetical protein
METRSRPENLQQVNKPISDHDECKRIWEAGGRREITDRFFCTGIFDGRDSVRFNLICHYPGSYLWFLFFIVRWRLGISNHSKWNTSWSCKFWIRFLWRWKCASSLCSN